MPAHRLIYRIPPQYAPMTSIAQWPPRLGASRRPTTPATGRTRSRIDGIPDCYYCDKALGLEVWWMLRPVRGSTHRSISGPLLFHNTFIASDDEQHIARVEAAMGVSLVELARRRSHRRHR